MPETSLLLANAFNTLLTQHQLQISVSTFLKLCLWFRQSDLYVVISLADDSVVQPFYIFRKWGIHTLI